MIFITIYLIFVTLNIFLFILSVNECRNNKNAYKKTPFYYFLGGFVWGDVLLLSMFWVFASTFMLVIYNIYFTLLVFSAFWLIRSFGETTYWLNQQFSTTIRYKPSEIPGYSIYKGDGIWFAFQVFMQLISVVSLICTIYFAYMWLSYI